MLYGDIVVIRRNGDDGTRFPLSFNCCLFGRSEECDIRVQLPDVAMKQCALEVDKNSQALLKVLEQNIGSVKVNGFKVGDKVMLKHNDMITIVERNFRFEYPAWSIFHIHPSGLGNSTPTVTPSGDRKPRRSKSDENLRPAKRKSKTSTPKSTPKRRPSVESEEKVAPSEKACPLKSQEPNTSLVSCPAKSNVDAEVNTLNSMSPSKLGKSVFGAETTSSPAPRRILTPRRRLSKTPLIDNSEETKIKATVHEPNHSVVMSVESKQPSARKSLRKSSEPITPMTDSSKMCNNEIDRNLSLNGGTSDLGRSCKRRVSFAAALSPEQFDKTLPPSTPIKKGTLPLTPWADMSSKRVSLRKSLNIQSIEEELMNEEESKTPKRESLKPQVVKTPKSARTKTPELVETPKSGKKKTPEVAQLPKSGKAKMPRVVKTPRSVKEKTPKSLKAKTPKSWLKKPLFSEMVKNGLVKKKKVVEQKKYVMKKNLRNVKKVADVAAKFINTPRKLLKIRLLDVAQSTGHILSPETFVIGRSRRRTKTINESLSSINTPPQPKYMAVSPLSAEKRGRANSKKANREILKLTGTPEADYTNVDGIKRLMKTPRRSPQADYTNVRGVKRMFKTPKKAGKTPKADYTNVDGVKRLLKTPKRTPKADYTKVDGVKRLMKTPAKSPKADYTNVEGVKRVLRTPAKSPEADYTNVFGLKRLMRTPQKSPEADYTNVAGVKRVMRPNQTPSADYTNVFGLKRLMRTPQKSPKCDYTNVEGVDRLMATPQLAEEKAMVGARVTRTRKVSVVKKSATKKAKAIEEPATVVEVPVRSNRRREVVTEKPTVAERSLRGKKAAMFDSNTQEKEECSREIGASSRREVPTKATRGSTTKEPMKRTRKSTAVDEPGVTRTTRKKAEPAIKKATEKVATATEVPARATRGNITKKAAAVDEPKVTRSKKVAEPVEEKTSVKQVPLKATRGKKAIVDKEPAIAIKSTRSKSLVKFHDQMENKNDSRKVVAKTRTSAQSKKENVAEDVKPRATRRSSRNK